jgi:hypothetical protein
MEHSLWLRLWRLWVHVETVVLLEVREALIASDGSQRAVIFARGEECGVVAVGWSQVLERVHGPNQKGAIGNHNSGVVRLVEIEPMTR